MTIDLDPETHWEPLLHPFGARTFVCSSTDSNRLRVRYFRDGSGALVAKAWFGPGAQGPPGHAHGGSMAAVLDEAMGAAAWLAGHVVLAARLSVGFHRMLPLDTVVRIRTRITDVSGRKVTVRGEITTEDGELICDGEGLYLELELERMDESGRDSIQKIMNLIGRSGPDDDSV